METPKLFKNHLICLVLLAMALLPTRSIAHGGEKHGKKKEAAKADTVKAEDASARDTIVFADATPAHHDQYLADNSTVHASIADFPHIHPLIVHFPIMLLMIAAVIQFLNILFLKKELNWTVAIMVLVGFITAYASSYWAHPHTAGLSDHAELVLKQHDKYAYYTVWLAGLGLVVQILCVLVFKGKRWSVAVAAAVLIGAGYAVTMAGHYGAQLVHIEGVGPQGKYLEQHAH